MLERKLLKNLIDRKNRENRKPLILFWARQTWKTTLVDMFAGRFFENYHRIDFQSNKDVCKIFEWNLDPQSLLKKIEIFLEKKIDIKNDLIFFDEIQECPRAIKSLKFFYEKYPNSYIIWAGSYLWLVSNKESFPVWKVEFMYLNPLTFEEFLQAVNKNLYEFYQDLSLNQKIDEFIHNKLIEYLRLYWIIGWMPEVVQTYLDLRWESEIEVFRQIRKKQKDLIQSYKSDFSKYSWFVNALHILYVYEAICSQLWQSQDESVKRFKFSGVIPKKKWFNDLIWPLTFLWKSRLVIKTYIANKWNSPLKAYIKPNIFKLYLNDIWLLNANLNLSVKTILMDEIWHYKWFIAENFVAQQIFSYLNEELISWSEWNAEIEFLLETENFWVVPIEVKSSKKYRRSKSLDSFIQRYKPIKAYKLTLENYYKSDKWFENVPLYLVEKLIVKLLKW